MKRMISAVAAITMFVAGNLGLQMNAEASQVDGLIEKLVQKGVLTSTDAETLRGDIETAEEKSYVEMVRSHNPWLEGLKSKGDIRLRAEGFEFDDSNRKDRIRERVRVRWGLEKEFGDEFVAGFRISTGPTDEAVSTNQSLDDEFDLKNLNLNRAYGKWFPTKHIQDLFPNVKHAEVGGGKFENPWGKWGTSIVWDGDVEPEGLYEAIEFKIADHGEGEWTGKAQASQFVLEEQSTKKDVNMEAFGFETKLTFDKKGKHYVRGNYVHYNWGDYAKVLTAGLPGAPSGFDASNVSGTSPGGNDRQIDAFVIHSVYLEGGMPMNTGFFGDQPVKGFFHWLTNDEEGLGVARPGNDEAWSAGIKVGKAKKQGSWEAGYQYFHIEENSTVGNFSESDIGTGGTNKEGHKLSYKYMLRDNIQLAWTNWLADDINNTNSAVDPDIWRTQLDAIYKF